MSFAIRPAHADEHAALWQIWHDAVAATHHFLDPADFTAIGEEVREFAFTAMPVDVIIDTDRGDDQPLGFRGIIGNTVEMLFVSPTAHGRGLGRALIAEVQDRLPVIDLDVNEGNPGAFGFYEHLGFTVIGRSETDDQGRPYPILHMRWSRA